jgi:hypothetical protein
VCIPAFCLGFSRASRVGRHVTWAALSAGHRGLLEGLVDERLKLHGSDTIGSLAAIESASSIRASIASRVEDPEIQASLIAAREFQADAGLRI